MSNENRKIASDYIEDKVKVEIGVMGLYGKSIKAILKDKKRKDDKIQLDTLKK